MPRTQINQITQKTQPPQHHQTQRSTPRLRRTTSRLRVPRHQSLRRVLQTQKRRKALLGNRNQVNTTTLRNLLFQLASALMHMHKNGFFHRDLKP